MMIQIHVGRQVETTGTRPVKTFDCCEFFDRFPGSKPSNMCWRTSCLDRETFIQRGQLDLER